MTHPVIRPQEAERALDKGQAEVVEKATYRLSNKLAHLDWKTEPRHINFPTDDLITQEEGWQNNPDGTDKLVREAIQRHKDAGWEIDYQIGDNGGTAYVVNPLSRGEQSSIYFPVPEWANKELNGTFRAQKSTSTTIWQFAIFLFAMFIVLLVVGLILSTGMPPLIGLVVFVVCGVV